MKIERCLWQSTSTIHLCINNDIINNIINDNSAMIILNKLYLKQKLYRHWIEKGGDLIKYLNIFKGILDKKVDVKIDKKDKALIIFTLLVDSYNNFMKTILYEKDTVTLE